MNPYVVVWEEESDPAGSMIYTIYQDDRGHVGFVTVRLDGTREYRSHDGQPIRAPVDAASAWDQAVNEFREKASA